MIRPTYIPLLILVLLFQVSCVLRAFTSAAESGVAEEAVPEAGYASLDKLPFKEGWYGMYFQDDKVGYSHFKIQPSGPNFIISSDSILRLTALKKTSEIQFQQEVIVRPDLTLISFESVERRNGKELRMTGRVEGNRFLVDMSVEGETLKRAFPIDGVIYHSSAMSLMPAMKGLKEGRVYSFLVFSPEIQDVQKVEQQLFKVVGEPGPNGAVWKVRNMSGHAAAVDSWIDAKGLTVLEKALDGALMTMLEDEATARKFRETKGPPKDLVFDFSLIRIPKPIPHPEKLRSLEIRMSGIDSSLIPDDGRQRVNRNPQSGEQDAFGITIRRQDLPNHKGSSNPLSPKEAEENLASTLAIQATHKEIAEQAAAIVRAGDSDPEKVSKLVRWTSENIRNRMKDSFGALSVLRSREGECQAHALLYAALARSQKIPTRVVIGLVYTGQVGFMYHAWAESYVDGWLAVDPTLNQVPADPTHIKISTGDSPGDLTSMIKMLGKVKIEVVQYK